MRFIESLKMPGLLSFPPDMEPFELESLNVLIGPNGSGKSNLIEVFELLRALPTDLSAAFREGGGVSEWLWKGDGKSQRIQVELIAKHMLIGRQPIRYYLDLFSIINNVWVFGEAIEDNSLPPNPEDQGFFYRYNSGKHVIRRQDLGSGITSYHELEGKDVTRDQSILSQRRDASLYPQLTYLAGTLSSIRTFREWSFGRFTAMRQPQPADSPDDYLLPDSKNLALILNGIEQSGYTWKRFNDLLKRFFPRFQRMTTRTSGGAIQFFLHETGFDTPIPATRISDGTLRFVAMLAVLMSPVPPPLVCIEEPELGLHPDAVALMGDVLKEASERMQLVITTHSSALVSEFTDRPNAVIACERPGAGTALRRLDPERVAHWLDEYTLGDVWRMGDLGANP